MKLLRHVCVLFLCGTGALPAQELKTQPTPFTALLDFQTIEESSTPAPLPIWLEKVTIERPKRASETGSTFFRLRLRRFPGLTDELMLRLFFDDVESARPVVSAWTDTGRNLFPPTPLGKGLGLPSSDTLLMRTEGSDYIEVAVPGDGGNLHRALIVSMQKAEVRQAADFQGAAPVIDPFDAPTPVVTGSNDTYLLGRVRATLSADAFVIGPAETGAAFEFELAEAPPLAVVTFEILNANIAVPPELFVNDVIAGSASLLLPDLADPGIRNREQRAGSDAEFRYAGWLRCQRVLPGSLMRTGRNTVRVQVDAPGEAVAMRAVEVQLKYSSNRSSP